MIEMLSLLSQTQLQWIWIALGAISFLLFTIGLRRLDGQYLSDDCGIGESIFLCLLLSLGGPITLVFVSCVYVSGALNKKCQSAESQTENNDEKESLAKRIWIFITTH